MNDLKLLLASLFVFLSSASTNAANPPANWKQKFISQVEAIDEKFEGNLGVYVKCLREEADEDSIAGYKALQFWYLASTTKIPIAVAVLQAVEQEKLKLSQKVVLKQSDFVDGSGQVIWKKPGAEMTIQYLLEQMLTYSDSTAADILTRLVTTDKVNSAVEIVAPGFGPVTTLLQVRYDVYSEIHPGASRLTNMDFIDLKKYPATKRPEQIAKKLGVSVEDLIVRNIDDAFERYYAKRINSSTLTSFGEFLEKLAKGELLNPTSTALILDMMEKMKTGDDRIKAGLPSGLRFAQKTGTQHRRICNNGLLRTSKGSKFIAIAACAEKFNNQSAAETALASIGKALDKSGALACIKP